MASREITTPGQAVDCRLTMLLAAVVGAGVGAVVVGAEVVGAEAVAAVWQWMSVRESLNESPASFLSTFAFL